MCCPPRMRRLARKIRAMLGPLRSAIAVARGELTAATRRAARFHMGRLSRLRYATSEWCLKACVETGTETRTVLADINAKLDQLLKRRGEE